MKKTVNAGGHSCPEPVLNLKQYTMTLTKE